MIAIAQAPLMQGPKSPSSAQTPKSPTRMPRHLFSRSRSNRDSVPDFPKSRPNRESGQNSEYFPDPGPIGIGKIPAIFPPRGPGPNRGGTPGAGFGVWLSPEWGSTERIWRVSPTPDARRRIQKPGPRRARPRRASNAARASLRCPKSLAAGHGARSVRLPLPAPRGGPGASHGGTASPGNRREWRPSRA
jgi:hypothetical protein